MSDVRISQVSFNTVASLVIVSAISFNTVAGTSDVRVSQLSFNTVAAVAVEETDFFGGFTRKISADAFSFALGKTRKKHEIELDVILSVAKRQIEASLDKPIDSKLKASQAEKRQMIEELTRELALMGLTYKLRHLELLRIQKDKLLQQMEEEAMFALFVMLNS